MSDSFVETHAALAQFLSFRDGTVAHPKGDGRVEIPHSIVRLMGWRDKSIVSVGRGGGCLVVSDEPASSPVGQIAISMERARIPMSMLRTAGMAGNAVVIVPSLTDRCVTVWPNLSWRRPELLAVLKDIGPETCDRLLRILTNREPPAPCILSTPTPATGGEIVKAVESETVSGSRESVATPAAQQQAGDGPKLFVMDTANPTVVRIIGMPFGFQSHWVPADNGTGRIVPHLADCPLCSFRSPERMFLVPVLRKKNGEAMAGFLLAQEDLRSKIARQLAGRNPTGFDLVLYHVPYSEGMCSVYKSPPEEMPESQIAAAQAACCDPNSFIAETFAEPEGCAPIVSTKAPMFIVEGHFAANARPRNLVK